MKEFVHANGIEYFGVFDSDTCSFGADNTEWYVYQEEITLLEVWLKH